MRIPLDPIACSGRIGTLTPRRSHGWTGGSGHGFFGIGRGFGVAIDTVQNSPTEPAPPSVEILTSDSEVPLSAEPLPGSIVDGEKHETAITNRDGLITASIDGTSYLAHQIANYVPPYGIWGFTVATLTTSSQIQRISHVTMELPRWSGCPSLPRDD